MFSFIHQFQSKSCQTKIAYISMWCPKRRKNESFTSSRCSHSPRRGSSFLQKIASRCSNRAICEFVHDKKYLFSNLPSSQKFLLASKSQKYAATYYSKAVLKPEPKKNLWDLPKRSPIYFKISPRRLLSHLGRYFFHQP